MVEEAKLYDYILENLDWSCPKYSWLNSILRDYRETFHSKWLTRCENVSSEMFSSKAIFKLRSNIISM